jgi:hypothetical protein
MDFPRRGQLLMIRVPTGGAFSRVRVDASRYFQFWNGGSGQVRITAEYGGQSVALPTIGAFATSPIYLNPFAGDGFLAFSEAVAGVGSNGWLIISGD